MSNTFENNERVEVTDLKLLSVLSSVAGAYIGNYPKAFLEKSNIITNASQQRIRHVSVLFESLDGKKSKGAFLGNWIDSDKFSVPTGDIEVSKISNEVIISILETLRGITKTKKAA